MSRTASVRREATVAQFIPPMKALGVSVAPAGNDWYCEIKFDGYRAIVLLNGRRAELWSRNQKPLDYPEVLPALAKIKCRSAVLDGEIVALDARGHSDFQTLQGRAVGERPPIVLFLFDLLQLDGRSLLNEPIEARRKALKKLLGAAKGAVRLSPSFDVPPDTFLAETRKQGLEGMILKRHGSLYESDRRSGAWLKVKNINEQEFVIGGFTPPRNSRQYFGSILIGYYEDEKLMYCGKVGSGFDGRLLASLHAKFAKLAVPESPFANLPLTRRPRFGQGMTAAAMRTVTWLKPKLVAQIKFAEWTQDGILRQPVFLGLRADKSAKQVRREAAAV
ncbi:MAG TPA: non-homologous end-joining DNA ligase [Lacunisphaera sp.]|nr:non-homologous end-joining DNA ligase [Lacunisphaera sp.]